MPNWRGVFEGRSDIGDVNFTHQVCGKFFCHVAEESGFAFSLSEHVCSNPVGIRDPDKDSVLKMVRLVHSFLLDLQAFVFRVEIWTSMMFS